MNLLIRVFGDGSEFHARGSATENDFSARRRRVLWMTKSPLEDERNRVSPQRTQRSAKARSLVVVYIMHQHT